MVEQPQFPVKGAGLRGENVYSNQIVQLKRECLADVTAIARVEEKVLGFLRYFGSQLFRASGTL
jgi:hypothetical protein